MLRATCGTSTTFRVIPINNCWTDTGSSASRTKRSTSFRRTKVVQRCLLMTTDPGDLVLDPPAAPARPLLSLSNGAAAGSRSTRRAWRSRSRARASWVRAIRTTSSPTRARASSRRPRSREPRRARSRSTGTFARLRLRARAAHHSEVDREQRRDRRHLGEVAGDARAASRGAERRALEGVGGVGDPARGRRDMVRARRRSCTPSGGRRASRGRRRSTRRSPRRRSSSTSTTGRTRTRRRCASPARSRSRA